jgi:hypothetical protein
VNTLDRYIARQYLLNIAILTGVLFAFVMMVDASINLPRFMESAAKNADDAGQKLEGVRKTLAAVLLVVDLWWPRLLQLFNYVIGLVLVGAMGFTIAQMVRQRELVAIMASGVSLFRVSRPIFVVAALVLGVQVANQELVMPRIAPLLLRNNQEAGKRDLSVFSVRMAPDSAGRLFHAEEYDPERATMRWVRIIERDASGRASRIIAAEEAVWEPAGAGDEIEGARAGAASVGGAGAASGVRAHGGSGSWRLEGGRAWVPRVVMGPTRDSREAPEVRGGGAGGAGGARGAARPVAGEVVTRVWTDLDPTTLLTREHRLYSSNLSWWQIAGTLGWRGSGGVGGGGAGGAGTGEASLKPEVREELERIAWGRVSGLVSVMLTLMVTMPYFLTREPGNMVVQSVKCAPVALGSVLGSTLAVVAPIPGLPPAVAVFVPVVALAPMAIAMWTSVKT